MKILTFSTLYPNSLSPRHGIFVETRLRHLLSDFESISAKVVAPVPWFPFRSERFGSYSKFARIPKSETHNGLDVLHPRYLQLPKIGMTSAPRLLALACLPVLKKIIDDGFDFDLIDAHYYFPDGVAASYLGKSLNKPVVVTARGTDINLIPDFATPRRMILRTANDIAASIVVSQGLKEQMVALGVLPEKIHVLRNGVDANRFKPVNREKVKRQLGWKHKTLISVGNLVDLKGHHLVIDAMRELSEFRLVIIGSGQEEQNLRQRCQAATVADRVEFISNIPQEKLRNYYGAADALILASSREGWPNVLLESMACGTPVIATKVGGTSEIVQSRNAGVLLRDRSPAAIAEGVVDLFSNYPEHTSTRHYAEQFDWYDTSEKQVRLFRNILATNQKGHSD